MSGYDPRRVRPNPTVPNADTTDDAAPIDALLGPAPTNGNGDGGENNKPNLHLVPDMPEVSDELPVPLRRVEVRPSFWLQLSPLLVATGAVLLFWLLRRLKKGSK